MPKFTTAIAPALLSTAALFALAGVAATPAPAAAQDKPVSAAIGFSDLDLSSDAGQKALESRIQRAARRVCGIDEVRTGTIVRSRAADECYRLALRSTRARVAEAVRQGHHGG